MELEDLRFKGVACGYLDVYGLLPVFVYRDVALERLRTN